MRVLCSTEALYWDRLPDPNTFLGIPLTVHQCIIEHVLQVDLQCDHTCDARSPCVIFQRAIQQYSALRSVCKCWNELITALLLENRQYSPKDWRIFYCSGSSTVAKNISLRGRYRGHESIEEAHDKSVLQGYDYGGLSGCPGKTEVIIKISDDLDRYENEVEVYSWDSSSSDIPNLYYSGRYGRMRYYGLVLSKLGPDLEHLRKNCRGKRFTPKMTLAVAIQTVHIYERFHTQGWLHCNAKPGNFAIGPDLPGQNNRIFMFDFEFARRIEHRPFNNASCTGWNVFFKPVTWKMHLASSRRDDLEGLGYVFSYLERGSHPWQDLSSSEEVFTSKICTPTIKLFEGMDPVYIRYFNDVKALAWGEIPDYGGIIQRFAEVWERKGYGGTPGEIDWWDELKLRTSSDKG